MKKWKKIVALMLAFVMGISFMPSVPTSAAGETEPTTYWTDEGNYDVSWYNASDYSFTLEDAADLAGFAVLVNGMNGYDPVSFHFKMVLLAKDVDLSAHLWTPIGESATHLFAGTFCGSGTGRRVIKNMTIRRTTGNSYVGLFGYATATLRDFNLVDVDIKNTGEANYTGGVVGYLGATSGYYTSCMLMNVICSGNIEGYDFTGGIAGNIYGGSIKNCGNKASVTGHNKVAGVVGLDYGWVSESYNQGTVKGDNQIGGIAGDLRGSSYSIENCYNTGKVELTGTNLYAGAIAAYEYGTTIENCYYLEASCADGVYSGSTTAKAGAVVKDQNAFNKGEVTFLLNGSTSTGSLDWYQNLDAVGQVADSFPAFTGATVYRNATYTTCDKSDASPTVSYSNTDLGDVAPAHVYQYDVNGAVLTETCKNCNAHEETATLKLDDTADFTYDTGKEHKPVSVTYSTGWKGGELTIAYENNINVGNQTAKAKITKEGKTAVLSFSITTATNSWTTEPAVTDWTYGESNGVTSGVAKYGTVDVTYEGTCKDGTTYNSSEIPTKAGEYTATFKVDSSDNYTGLKVTRSFKILQVDLETAQVLVNDVYYTGNPMTPPITVICNGKVLKEKEDYTISCSENHTDIGTVNVTVTGCKNYKGTAEGHFDIEYLSTTAVAAVSGTKGNEDWYISEVTFTAPTGYTISKTVNGTYTSKVTYNTEQNGEVTYYLKNSKGEIAKKSTSLKIDLQDPTATYQVKNNGWRSFVNFITFGLFYRDHADLTLKGSDTMDASLTLEYKISSSKLVPSEITDWITYQNAVALEEKMANYIYVRVTDAAGRSNVYESGVVVFTDCVERTSIEYYKKTTENVTAQIDFAKNTVKEIRLNGAVVETTAYDVTAEGIQFKASYLDDFAASDTPYQLLVSYNPVGVSMGDAAEGDRPKDTTIALTVKKQEGSVTNISDISKVYDGTAVSYPTYQAISTGKVSYAFKKAGAEDSAYTEQAPKQAGDYVIRVTVEADDSYKERSETADFTISKRPLTIAVHVADKQYDGLATAQITTAMLQNLADGDDVDLKNGIATFADVNVGEAIDISFTEFKLIGEETLLANYTLVQPTGIKAKIYNNWQPTEYTTSEPNANGWLKEDFVITAAEGYQVSLLNTDQGEWKDSLIFAEIGENQEVTFYVRKIDNRTISLPERVSYSLDKDAPSGQVSIDDTHAWESFVQDAKFELCYAKEVTVICKSLDSLSGMESVEYLYSEQAKTLEEVQAATEWTAFPTEGITTPVADEKAFIYYVRLTDKAGNVTYLSTDGILYDTTAPAIEGIEDGGTYYTTQVAKVVENHLDTVTVNGETVTDTITLAGNLDTTYTIVAKDKAGNETTVTVTMKTLGSLSDPTSTINPDMVKSTDKEAIEKVLEDINVQLQEENVTEEEKEALEEMKQEMENLLSKLEEAKMAKETEAVKQAEKITAENAKIKDKETLKQAKADLNNALKVYGDHYTEEEKQDIQDRLAQIEEALEAIAALEEAKAPKTGDANSNIWLWMLCLLLSAGGFGVLMIRRKAE